MTIYNKPAVRHAWAETAPGSSIADPGDSYVSLGWQIGVFPPRQYENWSINYISSGIRYLCQNGVSFYDPAESYASGGLVQSGSSGALFKCLINGLTGVDPGVTSADQVHWDVPWVPTALAGDATIRIANTQWVNLYYAPRSTPLNFFPGNVSNGQVPLSAVQQYQGALTIAFSQLSGQIFNSQVPLAAVAQWQGNLTIGWGQISGTKNADLLQGYAVSVAPAGNTLLARDVNGYSYHSYINQSSGNNENPAVNQVMVTNGADNFLRKAGLQWLMSQAGALFSGNNPGFLRFPGGGGIMVQFGNIVTTSNVGSVGVNFPVSFPNFCWGVMTEIIAASGVGGAGSYEKYLTGVNLSGFTYRSIAASNNPITLMWVAFGY